MTDDLLEIATLSEIATVSNDPILISIEDTYISKIYCLIANMNKFISA